MHVPRHVGLDHAERGVLAELAGAPGDARGRHPEVLRLAAEHRARHRHERVRRPERQLYAGARGGGGAKRDPVERRQADARRRAALQEGAARCSCGRATPEKRPRELRTCGPRGLPGHVCGHRIAAQAIRRAARWQFLRACSATRGGGRSRRCATRSRVVQGRQRRSGARRVLQTERVRPRDSGAARGPDGPVDDARGDRGDGSAARRDRRQRLRVAAGRGAHRDPPRGRRLESRGEARRAPAARPDAAVLLRAARRGRAEPELGGARLPRPDLGAAEPGAGAEDDRRRARQRRDRGARGGRVRGRLGRGRRGDRGRTAARGQAGAGARAGPVPERVGLQAARAPRDARAVPRRRPGRQRRTARSRSSPARRSAAAPSSTT